MNGNTLLKLLFIFSTLIKAQVTWQVRASFAGTARNHAIAFSHGTKGYVMTGVNNGTLFKDVWEYDSNTDKWTALPAYPGPGRFYGVGYVVKDKAYIGFGHSAGFLVDWWEYDFLTTKWTQKADFPGPGRDHPTCAEMNGKIYVGYGDDDYANYDDLWEYDPATDKWTLTPKYPGYTMHHPMAASYNNIVYIFGGHVKTSSSNYASKKLYAYNTLTKTWSTKADMPGTGKVAGAGFVLGNKLYGGVGIEEPVEVFHNEFYEYDIATDKWVAIANYPGTGVFAPVNFVIGSDGYVITGASQNSDTKNCYRLRLNTTDINNETNITNHGTTIYPNPAIDHVDIENETENSLVELYNTSGALINSYLKQDKKITIDVSYLPTGLYFIRTNNTTIKFVK